ncbi:bZIP transcription factor [Halocaridina rubra]|uniref:BZIP transcription factor n=1 Tax=Halocaridina rubra TaxID=373956 RepID=A0AAN8ZZD9_HALRR
MIIKLFFNIWCFKKFHKHSTTCSLSDEETRLLKKEGIILPTHYPLTKHEERELKRIRRKIRNKISAQDSRKRKKEYIDGLEDRVKACTEENQQLQKRIRCLEAENQSLLVQMRKFQNAVIGGSNGRSQAHASTALMMLILSAALFIVPSLRQDGNVSDSELSMPTTKMPSAGHSRSLLEAGNGAVVLNTLEALETVDDELASDLETPLIQALTDHDYIPAPKRQRALSKSNSGYYVPPLDDYTPQVGKTDSGGGFPPDDSSGNKIAARIMGAVTENAANNFSDPGGNHSNPQSVVVSLGRGQKRLRDDLELE